MIKYRYDIEPLGFSAQDDNVVVSHLFVYDNENNKISHICFYFYTNNNTFLYKKLLTII